MTEKKKKYHKRWGTSNIGKVRRIFRFMRLGMYITRIIPPMRRIVRRIMDPETSHGSAIPINKSLELPDNVMLPFAVTEHFVNKATKIFRMNYCGCRLKGKCKDYEHAIEIGCLWLGRDTERINVPEEIGAFISKEEALAHLRKGYEAGLVPSVGRVEADSYLMGALPDEGHFMSMCQCCPCCCVLGKLRYGPKEFSNILQRMEGITVQVDEEKCVGCGACTDVCVFKDALKIEEGKAHIDQDNCKGCGRCARKCPREAISITIDNLENINQAIDRIASHVDVT